MEKPSCLHCISVRGSHRIVKFVCQLCGGASKRLLFVGDWQYVRTPWFELTDEVAAVYRLNGIIDAALLRDQMLIEQGKVPLYLALRSSEDCA
jgi:hypothetical protein